MDTGMQGPGAGPWLVAGLMETPDSLHARIVLLKRPESNILKSIHCG